MLVFYLLACYFSIWDFVVLIYIALPTSKHDQTPVYSQVGFIILLFEGILPYCKWIMLIYCWEFPLFVNTISNCHFDNVTKKFNYVGFGGNVTFPGSLNCRFISSPEKNHYTFNLVECMSVCSVTSIEKYLSKNYIHVSNDNQIKQLIYYCVQFSRMVYFKDER